jgi:hypothetical protein
LTLFAKVSGEDFEDEIEQFGHPPGTLVKKNFRVKVVECIEKLLPVFKEEMEQFILQNDDERFDVMMGEISEKDKVGDELIYDLKVINFDVKQNIRKFTLVGELENEEFFAEVKRRWGFEEPKKYFKYCGGEKDRPKARLDSGPVFLSAGIPIESCEPFVL